VLLDDAATVPEDGSVVVPVLVNDTDVEDGTPLPGTVSVLTGPSNGGTVVNPLTGAVTYTPDPDYHGPDAFTYEACDAAGACGSATVTLTVTPVNDPPVAATDDRLGTEDGVLVINILANDGDPRDPTGGLDPGSVLALSGPFHGSVAFSPVTGAATYTPDPDYNGIDSFRYRVCDLGTPLPALCAQAVVNLALAPVNDAPLVQDDADATPEDTPVATDVAGNDSDPRDPLGGIDAASVSILTPPANGTAVPGPGAGFVTYTPDPGFLGTDSYVYRICDDGNPLPALCGTATVTITVSDEAPTAVNDAATTVEEVAVAIDVVANDTDPQPNLDTASVTVVTPPVKGATAVDPLTGVITYTPDPDANGADAFGYRICDLDGFCDQATVSVSIAPVNDPPLVQLDTETTPEDVAVTTPVTANDSDPRDPAGNIDPSTVSVTVPPANGTTVVNPVTGAVTYTPDPDFFGVDVYTYQVCDDGNPLPAACGTANVIVTVTPVNDPPLVVDDAAVTAEDTPAGIPVTDNDSDVEDVGVLPGSVTVLDAPDHGSAVVSPVTGVITYTPALNYNGPDSLRYRACDADGACDDALVLLTVTPVNDPPVTAPDAATTPEDVPVTVPVLANDNDAADPAGGLDPSSVSILVAPALGLAVPDPLTGAITYTPDPDANGTDALTYRVCDLGTPLPAACQTAVLSLTVTPVNDPPSVVDDVASTAEDSPVLIPVLANDDDDRDPGGGMDPGSVVVLVPPLHGSTSVSSGGVVTYTPDPGFAGVDSFRYEACDAGAPLPALCGNALVVVTVSNESPVAVDDAATLDEDGSAAVDVLANDTDPQNNIDPATVSILTAPGSGTAVPDPVTGVVTYTPAANDNGTDFFEYRVCDLTGYCDQARVDLTIQPVNDPPVALNDAETTPEDVSVTTAVLFNDNDAADPLGGLDPASVVVIVPPLNGTTAVLPLSGEIVYTPDPDVNGSDTYTYRVCDLGHPLPAACDQAVVVVTVNPVDDPIVAVDDAATAGIGTALSVPVLDNDLDPDGDLDPASVTVTEAPANGTAVPDGSGGVTYTPALAFFGLDTFTYRVCDANGNCDEARVVLTVTASPPVAVNDTFAVLPNRTSALDVLANDLPGTSALVPSSVSVTLLPTFGTAVPDPLDGAIRYTPDPDACGTDSLAYVVCDGDGLCASARVRVEVACIDLVAVDDSASTAFGESVTLAVLANDGGNADPDCLQVTEPPANGSADVQPDGTVIYTPDPGFSGTDCFRYAVCDTTESVVAGAVACVTVQPEIVLQVPVAFSPNGDGYNDRLFIPGLDDWPRHDLVIFNRWESRVFGAAPYGGDWDGRWEGNGEPLPDGTYFYILRLDPSDPDAPVLSGSINIVR
jgi:gliding motility-associated-like protein